MIWYAMYVPFGKRNFNVTINILFPKNIFDQNPQIFIEVVSGSAINSGCKYINQITRRIMTNTLRNWNKDSNIENVMNEIFELFSKMFLLYKTTGGMSTSSISLKEDKKEYKEIPLYKENNDINENLKSRQKNPGSKEMNKMIVESDKLIKEPNYSQINMTNNNFCQNNLNNFQNLNIQNSYFNNNFQNTSGYDNINNQLNFMNNNIQMNNDQFNNMSNNMQINNNQFNNMNNNMQIYNNQLNYMNNIQLNDNKFNGLNNNVQMSNSQLNNMNNNMQMHNNQFNNINNNIQVSNNQSSYMNNNAQMNENVEGKSDVQNNMNNFQNILDENNHLKNEVKELKKIIESKEKEIDDLKLKINSKTELVDFQKIIIIQFMSLDQKLNREIKCLPVDTFAEVEEKLYKLYPEIRETNNYFQSNGKPILRFKTLSDNGLKDGDMVILNILE